MSAISDELDHLRAKIAQIERDLRDARRLLDRLTGLQIEDHQATDQGHGPASVNWADTARIDQWLGDWFYQLGITEQSVGAENLQTMMLQEGVKPEENILSSGIVAMREE